MYELIRGPFVWISFVVCIGGSLFRLIRIYRLARKDKVVFPQMSLKHRFISLIPWIVPFASTTMKKQPVLAVISFAFHICLVTAPVFLLSHNLLWYQSWRIRWWSLPETVADSLTIIVILSGMFLLFRRLVISEAWFVTFASDYTLLVLVLLPFLTGFLAYHQWFPYKPVLMAHILSGEIMLITIPFTRLSHMLYFFFTRAFMGSDFGRVRDARDQCFARL